ncbi:MAG: hypothetical protein J7483_06785 [Novosphingobium sp.]|nr:hypothetical protein [Novosphingobium sp.]
MRILLVASAALMLVGVGGTAQAQDTSIPARVDRLEREMRAVQRKVFPGGAGVTVEPQITAETDTNIPGTPSTAPLNDLTQRVAALEGQIATLTGQVEQTNYRLRQLEDAYGAYRRTTDARLKALEDAAATIGAPPPGSASLGDVPPAPIEPPVTTPPRPGTRPPAETATTVPPPAPKAQPKPTPPKGGDDRAAKLAAVEKPSTGDAAEDGYLYGYRLWSAQLYPEAREALQGVVKTYPAHRRASYAQNLLGRTYLDAGAPSLAAVAFYENYKKNPNGERAPDSLYYLAQALVKLNKPAGEVCKVYTELDQLYGDRISQEMKDGIVKGRAASKCK